MSIRSVLLLGNYANDRQESMQRFARLLMNELTQRGVTVELMQPPPILGKLRPGGHGLSKWLGYVDKFIFFPPRLRKRTRQFKAGQVVHICDHSNAVYCGAVASAPHLVTCHDLLAIRSALGEIPQNRTGASGRIYQRAILKGLNRAQRVACVSKNTMADLRRLTTLDSSRVSLAYNGLNYPYRPMECSEALSRISKLCDGPEDHFILHVGGNQWYKNRPGVVRIYQELLKLNPNAPNLVLAGKEWPGSLQRQITEAGLNQRILAVHNCENEDLRALYSAAEFFLFPSLMEGFGWPIIEAQACGCPVATSNVAPMTEIGGDAAVYFDPNDPAGAARSLQQAFFDQDAVARTVRIQKGLTNAAKFGVSQMIDRYLEEYAAVAAIKS